MYVFAVSKDDHRNEDCIVVAVLTHGKEKGKLYAYDDLYRSDVLWSNFTGDVCPSLAGKPKIFILQVSVQNVRLFAFTNVHDTDKFPEFKPTEL
jgi:hypothetical protein